MLVRLLYASRAVDTSADAIDAILSQSRQHNPSCGITGILCYGGGIFLQAIEGGRMPVSALYGHIQKDPRHKDVALLHYEEITERQWPAPIRRGDFINFDRRDHKVDSVHLHYEGGAVCRIELDVIG